MTSDWIKMRKSLLTDPDVIFIATTLSIDQFSAVGRLMAVWGWLDTHSEDGAAVRISTAFIDKMAEATGFAEAMRAVGWLRGQDGRLTFPNFTRHNGASAKKRATEAVRKQEQRKRDKCPDANGTDVPLEMGPEKRREEKRREEPEIPPLPASKARGGVGPKVPSHPIALRIGAIFSRRPSTAWSLKEQRAFEAHARSLTEAELQELERYYAAERGKGDEGIHRRDLLTFLNNLPGERDRASAHAKNVAAAGEQPPPDGWEEAFGSLWPAAQKPARFWSLDADERQQILARLEEKNQAKP